VGGHHGRSRAGLRRLALPEGLELASLRVVLQQRYAGDVARPHRGAPTTRTGLAADDFGTTGTGTGAGYGTTTGTDYDSTGAYEGERGASLGGNPATGAATHLPPQGPGTGLYTEPGERGA